MDPNSFSSISALLPTISKLENQVNELKSLEQRYTFSKSSTYNRYQHLTKLIELAEKYNKIYSVGLGDLRHIATLQANGLSKYIDQLQKLKINYSTLAEINLNWADLQCQIEVTNPNDMTINPNGTITGDISTFDTSELEEIIDSIPESPDEIQTASFLNKLINSGKPVLRYLAIWLVLYLFGKSLDPFVVPLTEKFYSEVVQHYRIALHQIQKENKKIAITEHIDLSCYRPIRIVSKDNLPIWQTNASKSRIIGKGCFGDKVIILKKKKNWCKVIMNYEEDNSVVGWTYTRYLKPSISKKDMAANPNPKPYKVTIHD